MIPLKNSYTEEHKNVIIESQLRYLMEKEKIKGKLIYPPPKMDFSYYPFDIEHARGGKHPHDVTENDARNFIKDAYFVIEKAELGALNFFGKNGAAYVQTNRKKIRTAFTNEEYAMPYLKLIEVCENEKKT